MDLNMETAAGNVDSTDLLSRTGEEGTNKETDGPAEEDAKTVEAKEHVLFETMCDTVLSSLALLQSSINEILDFKDQLLSHALPSSLLAHLVITTGRLFRSASDMYAPTTELVRLVRFYATPWEQKKEILERLYADHERKKHQLGVAVRRLQLLDAHARRVARERRILNWEMLFGKLMTAKTHGRRWKFRVEYLKRKGALSLESQQVTWSPALSKTRDCQIDSELHVVSREAEFPQSLINREDREADSEESNEEQEEEDEEEEKKKKKGSDLEDAEVPPERESLQSLINREDREADSEESSEEEEKKEEGSDLEDAEVPTERFPWQGEGALFKKDTADGETQTAGQTEEQGTWTGDPLHHRFLCVTVTKFYGPFERGLSCLLTYRQERHQIKLIQDTEAKQKNKAPKQVKIRADKQDIPITGSISGILKTSEGAKSDFAKSAMESVLTGTQGAKFEMVMSGGKEDSAMLEVLLFRDREGVIAKGEFRLPQDLLMEQKATSDVEIQLFAPQTARSPARTVAALCISLRLEEMEELLWKDQSTEAWSLEELVMDATGIDLKETSRDELAKCLKRPELRESCTSAMSWASSSMAKSGLVPEEQVQLLIEEHNLQLSQLQELHEKQMWGLLESLRSSTADSPLDQTSTTERVLRSENAQSTAGNQSNDTETKEGKTLNHSARDSRSSRAGPKPTQKSAAARQQKMSVSKGLLLKRQLPQDVWERMKVLEENMWRSKQSTIEKLQSETSRNLEKQLSVQKRLQLRSDNRGSDSRSQDLCSDEICFPALFMPMRIGQVFTPKARLYFHPSGSAGFFRLTQAPSVLSLPPLGSSTRMSVLNLLNPRVTLPMNPVVQGNPASREDETIVRHGQADLKRNID
ncbi:caldesmon-like [Heptranchias perlo]|uniref:caldesmon-like n=1 Tax=Heptranchias perlo TaxID=212740 RepID=UPI00355A2056